MQKFKCRDLKSRPGHAVIWHTEIRPGTLTLSHLVCTYRHLLSKCGGGIRSSGPKQQRQSIHTHRVDVWTVLYKWRMSATRAVTEPLCDCYTCCFRCFTWQSTSWVKRSSNYSDSSRKLKGKEEQYNCFMIQQSAHNMSNGTPAVRSVWQWVHSSQTSAKTVKSHFPSLLSCSCHPLSHTQPFFTCSGSIYLLFTRWVS